MLKNTKTIFTILILVLITNNISAYIDVYDLTGEHIFFGEPLYEMWSYASEEGGWQGRYYSNWVHWDRFLRDFGSRVELTEWINNYEYSLILGRFETQFTPLTLNITRFRWGYPSAGWEWYKYYNNWAYDWGKWWEQRGTRLRAKKGSNEWTALIAKTADYGNDDEYEYRGDKWTTENIDKDRYLVAVRRKTNFLGIDLGFSFVNQHYTNFKTGSGRETEFFSETGPLVGNIDDNPPSDVYLKFSDDSPYKVDGTSDVDGAAVYNIKVYLDDKHYPEFDVVNGMPVDSRYVSLTSWEIFSVFSDRIEVRGLTLNSGSPNWVKYKFKIGDLIDVREIKEIKFLIEVANDYKIETSRDDVYYWTISRAIGNVKDYSNRTIITYIYGEHTGNTILGLDATGLIPYIGAVFKSEFAVSKKFYKMPTLDGKRNNIDSLAYYLELSKNFYPFIFIGKYYNIGSDYDASFSVEDNDDYDDKPDIVDDYVSFSMDVDKNRNSIADYEEDFLLFTVDREFREGVDLNNNRSLDNEENDVQPNYPYRWRCGRNGIEVSVGCRPLPNIKLETIYVKENEILTGEKNNTLFGKMVYTINLPIANFEFRHDVKQTKDTIRDNLVHDPQVSNPWADQRYESWIDPLDYRDNLVNNTFVTMDFKLVPNLNFVTRYLYGNDKRYYSDEIYKSQLTILRIKYDNWYPFKDLGYFENWQLVPMYKFENEVISKFAEINSLETQQKNQQQNSVGIVAVNKLTERTKLTFAQMFSYKDDLISDNDFFRQVFATEVVHNGKYWDKPLLLTAGIKFVSQSAQKDVNKEKYEHYYIKAYFIW